MKISIADNCGLKFSKDIKEHWEQKGHDVRYERGASEHLAQWADLYYFDWSDNNIHYIMNLYNGSDKNPEHYPQGWDAKKKPKIVVRAIDWDIWIGHARSQELVDWVDQWICIAPHLEKKLRAEATYNPADKLKLIRPGVNLDRFPLKKTKTDGFQLGMALGDMWWPKNHMAGLDIFTQLYQRDNRWRLHIRGQHEGGNDWWKQMYDHYLESRGIEEVVNLYPHLEDMNEFYEKIDVLLHPGMKEGYCYAVAEALAKGIWPVINNFYGASEIWGKQWLYNTHDEAVNMIERVRDRGNPSMYARKYVETIYDVKRMLQEYDELLGL